MTFWEVFCQWHSTKNPPKISATESLLDFDTLQQLGSRETHLPQDLHTGEATHAARAAEQAHQETEPCLPVFFSVLLTKISPQMVLPSKTKYLRAHICFPKADKKDEVGAQKKSLIMNTS